MSGTRVSYDAERVRRIEAVRLRFDASGTSFTDWAKEHGFEPNQVHQVISGKMKGRRGVGHRIAVALGIKDGAPAPAARDSASTQPADRLEGFVS